MVAKDVAPKQSKDDDDDEKEEKEDEEKDEDDEEAPKKKKSKKTKAKRADDFPTGKRKWFYNAATGGIETDIMGIKAEVTIFGQPKNWAEVELSPVNK